MKKIETNILNHMYWEESDVSATTYLNEEWNIIEVYPDKTSQKWLGMGGSITEVSAYLFQQLPLKEQEEFLNAYYGEQGLNYQLGRIAIGSNDFSLSDYTYLTDQNGFSIENDQKFILPFLKRIQQRKTLTLVASPWSPPACWKSNESLKNGGHLLKEYYHDYAKYLIHFLKSYEKEGIFLPFLTIQNEPYANQPWESCLFTISEQKEFLEILSEELKNSQTNILLWDHNKENLYRIVKEFDLDNPKIKGVALHNYNGIHADNLALIREENPNLLLLHTEGCCGFSPYQEEEWLKDAEYYLVDLIFDMTHGCNGYIDWNILLDNNGGPRKIEEYCKSPIILNQSGTSFIKTPIYYYLGHIARYFPPDMKICKMNFYRPDLLGVAGIKDDNLSIVLLNISNEDLEYRLVISNECITDTLKAHSIVTYSDSLNLKKDVKF